MTKRTGNIRRVKSDRRYYDRRSDEERRQLPESVLIRKILVTGDRDWADIASIVQELKSYRADTILIHGACRGADIICHAVAETLGFTIRSYPANWDLHKKAAWIIRNQFMLDSEHLTTEPIDLCIAFHADIQHSRGTKDMVKRVELLGIPVKIIVGTQTTKEILNGDS